MRNPDQVEVEPRLLARRLWRTVFVCGLLVTATVARAQWYIPRIVDPAKYASPSGRYVLSVEPTGVYGAGPATWRLLENVKQKSKGRWDYTPLQAVVTDDGVV